ncbi:C-type lectin domain family 4 member C-like [Anabas testudineus]|uniref:C-type lectin domain family 4 member C-like n=1 Tax=Anabas testudineus TaxID=64144 RepID=UPI000E462DF1|nr:C-type lectin domain family 4 member C-like [Anabas testudineus]
MEEVYINVDYEKLTQNLLDIRQDKWYWGSGQPNNGSGSPKLGEEDCGHIRVQLQDWNDLSCSRSSERRLPPELLVAALLCLGLLSVSLLIGLIGLSVHYHVSVSFLAEEKRVCGQKTTCPDGWTKFCWSCYFLSTERGSWTKGREDCRTRGADLVVIHSAEEQTFISTFINKNTWIGLNDTDKEGTWEWVDGTPLTVTYWGSNEPNNGNGGIFLANEDCVEISTGWSSEWNDLSCEASRQWICEKPAQP